ncbi:MAG: hypothetical protein K2N72_13870 [Oscillospiraceae bacterium]|nr:hypothetical protein [Oscillospiraceae bacterium]
MSPENEFIGGIADISYYNKWVEIKEKYFSGGNYSECLLKYAEFYIDEFGFEFLIPVMSFLRTAEGAEKLTEIAEDFSVS